MKHYFLFFIGLVVSFQGISQNYAPNFFPIGVWSIRGDYRGIDEFLYEVETAATFHHQTFSDLNNQGFNAAFLSYEPIINTMDTILSIAQLNELKLIIPLHTQNYLIQNSNDVPVSDQDLYDAYEADSIYKLIDHPTTLGYYVYDEPLPGWIDFDVLGNAKNILEEVTGGNHPILSTWNDQEVMDYISSYIDLDVIMIDTYPCEDGDAQGDLSDYMPSYFSTMDDPPSFSEYIDLVRINHCDDQGKPLWVVFQSFGDLESPENGGYWRQIYPKEIRLQAYTAIMQGAKGLWYFLYESEYPYLLGMLDVSGQPTQRLDEAILVNEEIGAISDILLNLDIILDYTSVTTDDGEVRIHTDTSSVNLDKYVIAINQDVFDVSTPTITVQKSVVGYEVNSIVDSYSNEYLEYTETVTTISFSPQISEGSGRMFKLSNETVDVTSFTIDSQVYLSPNPAKEQVTINHDYIEIKGYEVYSAVGKRVLKAENLNQDIIDLTKIQSGYYFIHLLTKTGKIVLPLIKR